MTPVVSGRDEDRQETSEGCLSPASRVARSGRSWLSLRKRRHPAIPTGKVGCALLRASRSAISATSRRRKTGRRRPVTYRPWVHLEDGRVLLGRAARRI